MMQYSSSYQISFLHPIETQYQCFVIPMMFKLNVYSCESRPHNHFFLNSLEDIHHKIFLHFQITICSILFKTISGVCIWSLSLIWFLLYILFNAWLIYVFIAIIINTFFIKVGLFLWLLPWAFHCISWAVKG